MAYKIFQQLESGMAEKGLVESSELGYTRNAPNNATRFSGNTVGGELDRINERLDNIGDGNTSSGDSSISIDEVTLIKGTDNKIQVNCATDFDGDNSRPIEAGYVKTLIGDIETLLQRV